MHDLHVRARHGIRLLIGRQAAMQILAIAGGIVVARTLGPGPLGEYGIAVFLVNVLALLADLGMGTALIQHAGRVTERQLANCFTLLQIVVTVFVVLLFVAAQRLAAFYPEAGPQLATLVQLVALDLYMRSWRGLSEVRLERELRYRELALADIAGSTVYQLIAVALVLSGWGILGLGWALLAGNFVRVSLLYRAAPWPLRLELHAPTVSALLRAGLPLQWNRIVTAAPTWIAPTLVGGLLGPQAVGLLVWASGLGRKPLEVLENVARVSLAQFARIQEDRPEVERLLARYTVVSLLAVGLWFSVLAVAANDLVPLIYTDRWLPGIPALLLYAGTAMLASTRWLANAAVIAVGNGRAAARVSTLAAVVAITTSILLVLRIGLLGVPLGQLAGVAVATPWLLLAFRPGAASRVLRAAVPVLVPLATAMLAGALVHLVVSDSLARGFIAAAAASIVFTAVAWRISAPWLRSAVLEELRLPALRRAL